MITQRSIERADEGNIYGPVRSIALRFNKAEEITQFRLHAHKNVLAAVPRRLR